MIKKIFLIGLLVLLAVPLYAQKESQKSNETPPTAGELLKWHEILTYEVRYSFVKLGEVKIEIVGDTLFNGNKGYYLKTIISSSDIPFVGDHKERFNTIFAKAGGSFKPLTFWIDDIGDDEFNTTRYIFDYQKEKVYGYIKEGNKRDTLALEKPATAGHLLFLLSRLQAGMDTTVTFPVYIDLKEKKIFITHTAKKVKQKSKAFKEPVMSYYTYGHVNFSGPFGFSGKFEAWYTAGPLRIPVEAHVAVWLGNVKLKLIKYKKELRK